MKVEEDFKRYNFDKNSLTCNECGRGYATIKKLKNHTRIHTKAYKEKRYTCNTCGKEYMSNPSLQSHIDTVHKGQRNFPCDICGKLFTRHNTLKTHKRSHNDNKPFSCIYCDLGYGAKRNLVNHINRSHPGCELRFKRISPGGEAVIVDQVT